MPLVRGVAGASGLTSAGGPPVRPREISLGSRVENNMRYHPVAPLAREQGIEVAAGEVDVNGGQTDGDKRCIPAPLVRVQAAAQV